jgi:WD40 repeat protein
MTIENGESGLSVRSKLNESLELVADSTTAGRALLTAADAAEQRAALELTTASQAEMEAGTETTLRAMSPENIAQAIAAQSGSSGGVETGDIRFTVNELATPDWLQANGGIYLKSAYPALAEACSGVMPDCDFNPPTRSYRLPTYGYGSTAAGLCQYYSGDGSIFATTLFTSPYIKLFSYDDGAFTELPGLTGDSYGYAVALNYDGSIVALGELSGSKLIVWKDSGAGYQMTGFARSGANNTVSLAISPNGTTLLAGGDSGALDQYTLNSSGAISFVATRRSYSDDVLSIAYSPDGLNIAIGLKASPFFEYMTSSYSALTQPAVVPSGGVTGVAFSDDGTLLVLSSGSSPYLYVYTRSGDTLTKVDVLDSIPDYPSAKSVAISHSKNFIAVGLNSTPYINIYGLSNGEYKKLALPAALPNYAVGSMKFSPDDTFLTFGQDYWVTLGIYGPDIDPATQFAVPDMGTNSDIAYIKT